MATLPFAAAPTLPVEIAEKIIDLLAADTQSLRHLSLVSQALRARALHHLLRSIDLRLPQRLKSLIPLLQANTALIVHIRHVKILCRISLLPQLWNVDTLSINDYESACDSALGDFAGWVADTFPQVAQLNLRHSVLCVVHDMPIRLLLSLPRLRSLDLDMIDEGSSCGAPVVYRSDGMCRLESLTLRSPTRLILDLLSEPRRYMLGALQTFEYHQAIEYYLHSAKTYAAYGDSLSSLLSGTTSLHSVRIVAPDMKIMSVLLQRIAARVDFAAHSSLRALSFRCERHRDGPRMLLPLVQQVPKVRGLRLGVLALSVDPLPDGCGWRRYQRALCRGRLPPPDGGVPELVLRLGSQVFTVASLPLLESVLGAATASSRR